MACFAAENTINELAEKIGMDPIEIRLKNAAKSGDESLMGTKYGKIGLIVLLA